MCHWRQRHMAETKRTYEQLKGKSVQCLLQEHPCMAYEEELMMAAAVLSGVKIIKIVKRDEEGPTTINDMLKLGVVRSHTGSSEEHKANQSKALAAFIAVFEEQAEMHRQYEELFNEQSKHPQAALGQQLAAV